MNPDNIIVFLDNIQRTIIATKVEETESKLVVTKPAILNVTPTPDKKLQVQLFPLFFREFTADRNDFPNWSYARTAVAVSDADLELNLIAQYRQMFITETAVNNTNSNDNKVIKLFDEN